MAIFILLIYLFLLFLGNNNEKIISYLYRVLIGDNVRLISHN